MMRTSGASSWPADHHRSPDIRSPMITLLRLAALLLGTVMTLAPIALLLFSHGSGQLPSGDRLFNLLAPLLVIGLAFGWGRCSSPCPGWSLASAIRVPAWPPPPVAGFGRRPGAVRDGRRGQPAAGRARPGGRERAVRRLHLAGALLRRTGERSGQIAVHVEPAAVFAHETAQFVQAMTTPGDAVAGDEFGPSPGRRPVPRAAFHVQAQPLAVVSRQVEFARPALKGAQVASR